MQEGDSPESLFIVCNAELQYRISATGWEAGAPVSAGSRSSVCFSPCCRLWQEKKGGRYTSTPWHLAPVSRDLTYGVNFGIVSHTLILTVVEKTTGESTYRGPKSSWQVLRTVVSSLRQYRRFRRAYNDSWRHSYTKRHVGVEALGLVSEQMPPAQEFSQKRVSSDDYNLAAE